MDFFGEWFVAALFWSVAGVLFKRPGAAGRSSTASMAAGFGLVVTGIALLVVRFGFQHAGSGRN